MSAWFENVESRFRNVSAHLQMGSWVSFYLLQYDLGIALCNAENADLFISEAK